MCHSVEPGIASAVLAEIIPWLIGYELANRADSLFRLDLAGWLLLWLEYHGRSVHGSLCTHAHAAHTDAVDVNSSLGRLSHVHRFLKWWQSFQRWDRESFLVNFLDFSHLSLFSLIAVEAGLAQDGVLFGVE